MGDRGLWRCRGVAVDRLHVRRFRGDEGQRAVVEHRSDDDGSDAPPVRAKGSARAQHRSERRSKRRHLFVQIPLVATAGSIVRRSVFGKDQRKAAHEPSVRSIQLNGGRDAVSGQLGLRPDDERAVCRGRLILRGAGDELRQRGDRFDRVERMRQAHELEILSLSRHLRREISGDRPLSRRRGERVDGGIHRDRRNEQGEKQQPETGRLRGAANRSVRTRQDGGRKKRRRDGNQQRADWNRSSGPSCGEHDNGDARRCGATANRDEPGRARQS